MQLLNSALAPPIVVVFAAALLWPRANATGALCCLLLGHAAGLLRLGLGAALPDGSPELRAAGPLLRALASVNFLLWTAAVGGLSVVTLVVTDLGLFAPTGEGFALRDLAPGVTLEEVRAATACPIIA
jgi:Na+/proline symporter